MTDFFPPYTDRSLLARIREGISSFTRRVSKAVANGALTTGQGIADWAWCNPASCTALVTFILPAALATTSYRIFVNDHAAAPAVAEVGAPPVDPMALAPGEKRYKIRAGDTLGVIAEKNKTTVEALRTRNAIVLKEWEKGCTARAKEGSSCADVVIKGKFLVIPAGDASPASPAQ